MPSPVLLLWSLLSVLVAGTCTFTFLQPFWLVHSDLLHAFGLVAYCYSGSSHHDDRETCSAYGGNFRLGSIPSGAWQAACVLYGAGCVLACLGALLSLCSACMPGHCRRRVTRAGGYVQTVSVLIMIAGLLIFPLGLSSKFFRHYCGDSAAAYNSGHCLIGWSYMLGIMGTALSIFCPFLSQFTDMKASDIFS
ncbi:transmembrane protein 211-like [Pomacea canaliculata]|uniref:transmembrane protein 211-like n=1 Tax=Pomacea canaliculata TaxID=400727 RepID=UPI000D73FAE1|nr:transmembrane protein 211-like [Pomacea canaliculata]XP_025092433.1 transmembrane protein 211-like [Pomacea canaliculata]XP_025092434.1 transmembrane protein 211-like [Pomacea canaliculata]XP_025092435.1 transmembrane protein 211-like [Pomacea canaliculata]